MFRRLKLLPTGRNWPLLSEGNFEFLSKATVVFSVAVVIVVVFCRIIMLDAVVQYLLFL